MSGSDTAGEDDLLLETRQLLNSLNEENGDLKAFNHKLTQKLRQCQEALQDEKRRCQELEHDGKQVNFSLMQQLQAATADRKAAAGQLAEANATCDSQKAQLVVAAERVADVESRAAASDDKLDARLREHGVKCRHNGNHVFTLRLPVEASEK